MTVKERSQETIRAAGGVVDEALPELHSRKLRSQEDILGRTLALYAILHLQYLEPEPIQAWLEAHDLMIFVSPDERRILAGQHPDSRDDQRLYWWNESLWALSWVLGVVEELPFTWRADEEIPAGLAQLGDPPHVQVNLRSYDEVFAQLDLHYRLGWYTRSCLESYQLCPFNYDVVMERLRALAWTLGTDSWDEVDVRNQPL